MGLVYRTVCLFTPQLSPVRGVRNLPRVLCRSARPRLKPTTSGCKFDTLPRRHDENTAVCVKMCSAAVFFAIIALIWVYLLHVLFTFRI